MSIETSSGTASAVGDSLTRDDCTALLVDLLKLCKPANPYYPEGVDPYETLTADQIKTSYCKSTSATWARCGPCFEPYVAHYAVDLSYFRRQSFERVLAITTHELTHVAIGTQNGPRAPMHPPNFWNEMAYHAQVVLDHVAMLERNWGAIDAGAYRRAIINDPNEHMVDARSETVADVQQRLLKWVGSYPKNKAVEAERDGSPASQSRGRESAFATRVYREYLRGDVPRELAISTLGADYVALLDVGRSTRTRTGPVVSE